VRVEECTEPPAEAPKEEYEFVMGARQLAGLGFVAIAAVALFSTISYMTGKAASEIPQIVPALEVKLPQPPPPQLSVGDQFTAYAASLPSKAAETPASSPLDQGPLFGEPQAGMTYIQMAAVEKAVAGVFVEGLRTHGLSSFATQNSNTNIYRVLIGPLPDPGAYKKAKTEVDKMGLSTFARQYEK
jgi:cell division septation protein DedD